MNADPVAITLQAVALVGYFAYIHQYGAKKTTGPLLGVLCEIAWLALSLYMGLWLIAMACIVGGYMHGKNYFKWRISETNR